MKNKRKVLVLGATGLLGHHCFKKFNQENYQCLGTYNTNKVAINNYVHFDASADKEELKKLLESYKPDVVVNTIAYVTVDGCEENPKLAESLNATFVKDLVETLKKAGLGNTHLIQISSDSVYGNKDGIIPWKEDDQKKPLSVYASTKLEGEEYAKFHLGPVSILRTAFYGINPYSEKSLLYWVIDNARKGTPMDGWENIYFCPVSASKLADVIEYLVEKKVSGIFNVGSTDMCNKYDFVFEICNSLNLNVKVNKARQTNGPQKQIRPNDTSLDCTKLKSVLPWETKWKEDLNTYLKSLLPLKTEES
jgi:dTDP-4-dehydrorhamnose reductase